MRQVVDEAAGHGAYVILDLHWSDAGEWGKQIGQHVMPDPNSVPFWRDVATAYKNAPAVLFDLYILAMTPFALAKTENAY